MAVRRVFHDRRRPGTKPRPLPAEVEGVKSNHLQLAKGGRD